MSTLTDAELEQIEQANATGLQPVVFIHGLWLLSSSWQNWRSLFEENGFSTIAPGWPDDPASVDEARENPEVFAHKMVKQVTDHYLEAIDALTLTPAVVGHSFGGLIAQKIAGVGASEVTVAIDPAPFQGVLPLPVSSLKSSAPVLANPLNFGKAVSLTLEQFTFGWANNLEADEAKQLWETYHVAASGVPLFQAATANFNPFTETKVDTKNPDRGPLLIVSGEHDNTVPRAMTEAAFRLQEKNPGLTRFIEIPGRGHSLTIDHGWKGVADEVLAFVVEQTAID